VPGDQHAEGGGSDFKAFGDMLADLVERAAASRTGLLLNIDDLLDPFKMGEQRSAVGLARALALSSVSQLPNHEVVALFWKPTAGQTDKRLAGECGTAY
jgi:hypothetical protein